MLSPRKHEYQIRLEQLPHCKQCIPHVRSYTIAIKSTHPWPCAARLTHACQTSPACSMQRCGSALLEWPYSAAPHQARAHRPDPPHPLRPPKVHMVLSWPNLTQLLPCWPPTQQLHCSSSGAHGAAAFPICTGACSDCLAAPAPGRPGRRAGALGSPCAFRKPPAGGRHSKIGSPLPVETPVLIGHQSG